MTVAEIIYNALEPIVNPLPLAPIIQAQTVEPPAVVYDYDQDRGTSHTPEDADIITLSVMVYHIEHQKALETAQAVRTGLKCYTDSNIYRAEYEGQEQAYAEPLYVVAQTFIMRILNN